MVQFMWINLLIYIFKDYTETYVVEPRRFIHEQNFDKNYSLRPLPQRALLQAIITMQVFAYWQPR